MPKRCGDQCYKYVLGWTISLRRPDSNDNHALPVIEGFNSLGHLVLETWL